MRELLYFTRSDLNIGYHSRISTQGAELNMVNSLVEQVIKANTNKNIAIFIEPQLESGYPDVVFVEYANTETVDFNSSRLRLSPTDLKILFEITQVNSIAINEISKRLGYCKSQVNKTLKILTESNLVTISTSGKYVRKRLLRSFFIIKKIISVEAKIGKWHDVIEQSYTNQWFSSESYILLDKKPNLQCEELCHKDGTGILSFTGTQLHKIETSTCRKLPVSYVSLLFNEWLLRRKFCEGKIDD